MYIPINARETNAVQLICVESQTYTSFLLHQAQKIYLFILLSIYLFISIYVDIYLFAGLNIVVSIAHRYGLEGQGIETRWGASTDHLKLCRG